MRFIQRGENPKYPVIIECWRRGETPVPEWLTDQSRIQQISDDGTPVLLTRETNAGGYEIVDAAGSSVLVKTQSDQDYICYAEGYKIFSLTPKQMEHLYTEITKKKRNK